MPSNFNSFIFAIFFKVNLINIGYYVSDPQLAPESCIHLLPPRLFRGFWALLCLTANPIYKKSIIVSMARSAADIFFFAKTIGRIIVVFYF
jgi:hypothetical protein